MRNMLSHQVTGYHLIVHLLVCASMALGALFVSLAANTKSDRKFCDVITQQQIQSQRQIDLLEVNPPSTPAGAAILQGWRDSLLQFQKLSAQLGCQEAKS